MQKKYKANSAKPSNAKVKQSNCGKIFRNTKEMQRKFSWDIQKYKEIQRKFDRILTKTKINIK